MASERAEKTAMASNRKISSNTSTPSSLSPPALKATQRPQEKRKPGGAKDAGLWMKRMDMVEEDIDASAEKFIKRFRENLLLQRLQSIENYKQMLARGV
ncbi:hypothetical protein IEQ34_020600 [Dendrobium chrysotoxum]|uniref:Uncharacterized protein n=1 Tax=Dendrobium chrysotoxum TaxID=161865 RepID=A0AAV7G2J0_DENCH|nr:hypothetical protein IEQ34_020600 [Dendrobium chrysotoxum]